MIVMGIAAPHWIKRGNCQKSLSLNSSEPFSQYNAFRYAAYAAEKNIGFWGDSNWTHRKGRNDSVFMMEHLEDDLEKFETKLEQLQPNVLLIGAMTLGLPGAIEIANLAKKKLGSNIFIVLGGKHITEAIYTRNGNLLHHSSSPIKLMAEGTICTVFDLVIAGDGEEITFEIGQILGHLLQESKPLKNFYKNADNLLNAKGNWIASWIEDDKIKAIISKGIQLNYDTLKPPAQLFGVKSNFPVFQRDLTSHAYSDMSKGCKFDCFFCSEKRSINGSLVAKKTASYRLFRQLEAIEKFGEEKNKKMSAFVEDSIILGGLNSSLIELNQLLGQSQLDIKYGGQLTVDLMLQPGLQNVLKELSQNGLSYLFWGLETSNLDVATQMSKNTKKQSSWVTKNESVIRFLTSIGIKCGVSVLSGIGEDHQDRIELLNVIKYWKEKYGQPEVISLNLGVQHPLQGFDNGANYTYVDWGTSADSPYLDIFTEFFGEASVNYPISGTTLPTVEELAEVTELYLTIKKIVN